jgi:hypothetical protein
MFINIISTKFTSDVVKLCLIRKGADYVFNEMFLPGTCKYLNILLVSSLLYLTQIIFDY